MNRSALAAALGLGCWSIAANTLIGGHAGAWIAGFLAGLSIWTFQHAWVSSTDTGRDK